MSDVTRDEAEPQEPTEGTSADEAGDDEEASPAVAEAPKRSGSGEAQQTKGQPPSEEKLNAPSMQTVGMLAVVAAATLVMWAAGRAACNYHEPGESLSPRAVALAARTRTPKDVAFELSQRWLTADFATAEQLVGPELLPAVQKDKASCTGASCEARRSAKALSTAEVLAGNSVDTRVRVRTIGIPQGDTIKLYQVERVGNDWKVTRELDPKAPLPPLKEPPPGTPQMGGTMLLQPGQGPVAPGAPAPSAPTATPAPAAPAPAAPPVKSP